ncbi:MAG: nucleolar RNA-binding Nop10p family protein [Candidatus Nanoarchaeia archaeon]
MPSHILYCSTCTKYTLQKTCSCGTVTITSKPAKWNPEDKYAKYRLKYKQQVI